MRHPIVVPNLGAPSITLSVWYVKPGEPVFEGDRIVELLIGSATFDVTATASGTLVEQLAAPDEALTANQVIGHLAVRGGHS